jgi:sugar/nucleoside kinase (ribokinase family)
MNETRKILVAGTICFDTVETPYEKREKIVGGSGNYFALAANPFTKLELSSIIGCDFPLDYLEKLNAKGIGTSNIEKVSGKTFFWEAKYLNDMNIRETLKTEINVLCDYNPTLDDRAKECEILFLANVDPEKQIIAAKRAKNAKLVVCDTINFWIENKFSYFKEVLKYVDVLIINDSESFLITKEENIHLAAKKIMKMGPSVVIIKRGEYGSVMYYKNKPMFFVPAYPVEKLIDPTGAGDSFAGGFTGYLATVKDLKNYKEMKKAMLYGASVASFTVEGFGTDKIKDITKKDIEDRYQKLLEIISL